MSKLKPCINDMCYMNDERYINTCAFWDDNVETCKKYLTEKPESAWELRKKLFKVIDKIKNIDLKEEYDYSLIDIENMPEQEAIKIMQEIEKELKE